MLKMASAAEQVASHLKEELMRGRWPGAMPGRDRLAREARSRRKHDWASPGAPWGAGGDPVTGCWQAAVDYSRRFRSAGKEDLDRSL